MGFLQCAILPVYIQRERLPRHVRQVRQHVLPRRVRACTSTLNNFVHHSRLRFPERTKIFRRDTGAVETLDDMRRIMRYNEFQVFP